MKRKRPTISDGMKYRALKLSGRVWVYCNSCLLLWARSLKSYDDCKHQLADIQFDHVWELADRGKHGAKHLRPICIPCHKEKSAKAEKLRHHLDRAGKKHRGTYVSSKPKRPIANRKDAWTKGRTLPTGRKMQTNEWRK